MQVKPGPQVPIIDVHGFRLPASLHRLAAEIEESRSLLELADDWDGDGTRGYAEQTWHRAVDFLVRCAIDLAERFGVVTDAAELLPGADGSLGIDWRTDGRELLVTIPADPAKDAPFYGDDGRGRRKIKGTLDTSAPNRWLVAWLAE